MTEAVRDLLSLPTSVPLQVVERDTTLVARIGEGADQLELKFTPSAPAHWVNTEEFGVDIKRFRDGRDPKEIEEWRPLLRSLKRRLEDLQSGRWANVVDAVSRARPYRDLDDSMYRQVTAGEALIRLGFRCNQRCDFCWQDRSWPEPPPEFYAQWVDEMAAAGVPEITLSGGEPTLHHDLPSLVRRIRSHGCRVRLQTNCVRMAKPGYAEELAAAGVHLVFVSYHAHEPAVSDAMTRAPGTHGRTVAGIEACLDAGITVLLNAVIDTRNYASLPEYAAHIVERFAARASSAPISVHLSHPCAGMPDEPWHEHIAPLDLVQPYLVEAIRVFWDGGVIVGASGTGGFPACILRDVPEAIWEVRAEAQNRFDRSARAQPEPCRTCAFSDGCLGARREYVDRFGGRGLVPFDERPAFGESPQRQLERILIEG